MIAWILLFSPKTLQRAAKRAESAPVMPDRWDDPCDRIQKSIERVQLDQED